MGTDFVEVFFVCNCCLYTETCNVCIACLRIRDKTLKEKLGNVLKEHYTLRQEIYKIIIETKIDGNSVKDIFTNFNMNSIQSTQVVLNDFSVLVVKLIEDIEKKETEKGKSLFLKLKQLLDWAIGECSNIFGGKFEPPEITKELIKKLNN